MHRLAGAWLLQRITDQSYLSPQDSLQSGGAELFISVFPSEDQLLWCTLRIAFKDFVLQQVTGISVVYYLAQYTTIYRRLSYYTDTISVPWLNLQAIVFSNTRIRSSLVDVIYFNWQKKGELNRLDRTWLLPLFYFIMWEPSSTASALQNRRGTFVRKFL